MEVEAQQLIDVIKDMNKTQGDQLAAMDSLLRKMGEDIHKIKNDYHGTAQLVQMIREEKDKEVATLHVRIDKHATQSTELIKKIESELSDIAPMAKSWQKVYDNASKVFIGAMMLGLIAVAAGYVSK